MFGTQNSELKTSSPVFPAHLVPPLLGAVRGGRVRRLVCLRTSACHEAWAGQDCIRLSNQRRLPATLSSTHGRTSYLQGWLELSDCETGEPGEMVVHHLAGTLTQR